MLQDEQLLIYYPSEIKELNYFTTEQIVQLRKELGLFHYHRQNDEDYELDKVCVGTMLWSKSQICLGNPRKEATFLLSAPILSVCPV